MPASKKNRVPQTVTITFNRHRLKMVAIFALTLLAVAGYYRLFYLPPLRIATAEELRQAEIIIEAQGFKFRATDCYSDTKNHEERLATYDKYFKINKFANRAVIRGCNDIDTLLAKNERGVWEESYVNLSLDTRANPVWQQACLINDITIADNVVRPENNSIDQFNLEQCQYMRKYNSIKPLP